MQAAWHGMAENISAETDAVVLFFSIDDYRYLRDETGFSAAERPANKKGTAVIASYLRRCCAREDMMGVRGAIFPGQLSAYCR